MAISRSSERRVKCMGMRERSRWASAAIFKMALAETGLDLGRRWLQYSPASAKPRMRKKTTKTTERFIEIGEWHRDRKSTRLNSSHSQISYAVFCLKKKKKRMQILTRCKIVNSA